MEAREMIENLVPQLTRNAVLVDIEEKDLSLEEQAVLGITIPPSLLARADKVIQ